MRMRLTPSAWLRRTIGLLAVVPVLVHVGPAAAQSGAADPQGSRHYHREATFKLPITIDEKARPTIREVQLFVRTPATDWQRRDAAPPSQPCFTFKALADGEYWFTLVTVDTNGVPTPADFSKISAAEIVKVVVDTTPPAFDVQSIKGANGETLLRCTVNDANPDPRAIKITCRGSDQAPRVLDPLPGQPSLFTVPSPEMLSRPILVSVTDLAKNTTAREITLPEFQPKQAVAQQPNAVPPNVPGGSGVVQAGGMGNGGSTGVASGSMPAPPPGGQSPAVDSRSPQPAALPGTIQRQLLNTTRASLDYRIDQVGPSGVGKVEVWMTSDQGASWKRLCEDVNRRSPTEFDLPGDGLYGVRVAVTNGNGFGGRTPAPGEQPHVWIEVDTIAPVVHLRDMEPISNGNSIDIRWNASDKNLGPEPINLYYANRREGPWLPVARGVKNDGLYRWTFPRDTGSQFFVRVEAVDQAGNVGRSDSPTAIVLDMTEPRASVVGVSGVPTQPAVLRGN